MVVSLSKIIITKYTIMTTFTTLINENFLLNTNTIYGQVIAKAVLGSILIVSFVDNNEVVTIEFEECMGNLVQS
ncbi:hypothetical protein CGPG_00097 [Cellulophaga phage phiST]|uniref:Uncharacterized protein n=3 Tax=Cellulophaga phage phiST TaxID=756282 RepID=M4SND2_9CAUD|nr:hypothetical protein CGPG_00097 [Cellulophaga phage phiST]AGH56795.1 hypothetical protein CGPG_00097 [Cellulophaga phage phiST]